VLRFRAERNTSREYSRRGKIALAMNNNNPENHASSAGVLQGFDHVAALAVVREASTISLSLRGKFEPDLKADDTLVTEADRQIEEFLQEKLAPLAPQFSFLGEEGGLTGEADAPCWVIDPIDGTTNFVRGIPLWCISVGLVYRGRAIFGAIAVPPQNELYWAKSGDGAWLEVLDESQKTRASTPEAAVAEGQAGVQSAPVSSGTRLQVFDSNALQQEDLIVCNTTAERAVNWDKVPCRLRNLGTLAYHLASVARGSMVGALSHYYGIYDIAAGICICEEAGCVARYLDGSPWIAQVEKSRGPRPLLVAPPVIAETLLDNLEPLVEI
jgi:myo-inositol-1(or 4)-monophosphatase